MTDKLNEVLARGREIGVPESDMVVAQLKGLQDVGIPHDILQRAIDRIRELEEQVTEIPTICRRYEANIKLQQGAIAAKNKRSRELQAKLDAVTGVESYSVEFPAFGRPATVMLTKDVLAAIGDQSDE